MKINRHDTIREVRRRVFEEYRGETFGVDGSVRLVPFSGAKQNVRESKRGQHGNGSGKRCTVRSRVPFSVKGVLSKNLVYNVANGVLDHYTLSDLNLDSDLVTVFYVLFTWPSQETGGVDVERLLRIVDQGEYNPLKNTCLCSWRGNEINAESVNMLTTILKTHYIFANIPWRKEKHSAHEFAQSFKAMTFKTDDFIITQGEDGDNFYVIESGYVDIVKNGKKIVTIGPLDAFGELALVGKCHRNASCIAISRVRCWALGVEDFLRLVDLNDVGSGKAAAAIRRQLLESGADVSHIAQGRWAKLKAAGRMRGALMKARRRQSAIHVTRSSVVDVDRDIENTEKEDKRGFRENDDDRHVFVDMSSFSPTAGPVGLRRPTSLQFSEINVDGNGCHPGSPPSRDDVSDDSLSSSPLSRRSSSVIGKSRRRRRGST